MGANLSPSTFCGEALRDTCCTRSIADFIPLLLAADKVIHLRNILGVDYRVASIQLDECDPVAAQVDFPSHLHFKSVLDPSANCQI